jgi:predicted O-methyltransferase YrrM
MQSIRGFQESRAILTAIELDLFTAVGAGGTAAAIAKHAGADPRATEMLLNAIVALNLLAKRNGVFENTPASARYFVAGGKDDSRAALTHTAHLWWTWSKLTDCVRAGTAVGHEDPAARADNWTEAFIAAMHRNATERAGVIVSAADAGGVRRMLDVGGGSGAYSIAFARQNPQLEAEVFDLATVTPIATRHIAAAGFNDRVRTRVGDLRRDSFGTGYDLVFVSAICHMLTPEENSDLLRRSHDALAPGGRAIIQDFILEPDKTAPKIGALFALNMLVGTRGGSSYSEPEYRSWMEEAGFHRITRIRLPGPTGLMIGYQ